MYVVQRRDSEKAQWKTCSMGGKKCRFEYIAQARTTYRRLKKLSDELMQGRREFRIIDTEDNNREVD